MQNNNHKKVTSGKKQYVFAFVLRFLHNIFVLIILHHFTVSHFLHLCFFHSFHGVMIFHQFLTRVLLTPGAGASGTPWIFQTIIHDPVQLMISWGFQCLKWWFNVIYGNLMEFTFNGIYHYLYTGHFDVVFLFSIFSVENKQPPHFVGYSRRKKHASHAL